MQTGTGVNIVAGSGSYSYQWTLTVQGLPDSITLLTSPSSASASIKVTGSRTWVYGWLSVTVTDLNTRMTATATNNISVQFGNAQQT